jgi:hypothetical protein
MRYPLFIWVTIVPFERLSVRCDNHLNVLLETQILVPSVLVSPQSGGQAGVCGDSGESLSVNLWRRSSGFERE